MTMLEAAGPPWPARALSILRIVAGLLFVSFGTMKMLGYPHPPAGSPTMHFGAFSEYGIAGILETFGGMLLVVGLCTRPVAFLLSGEMAVAYFQYHFPTAVFPQTNNGVPAVMFCFLWLYYAVAGGGPWSLDALIARRRLGPRG